MARQEGKLIYNSFNKGLITEAEALSYPENSSEAESNTVLSKKGNRRRRLGVDYEDSYDMAQYGSPLADINFSLTNLGSDTAASSLATKEYLWKNVNGDPSIAFNVQQIGRYIYFFDGTENNISAQGQSFRVDLDSFDINSNYASEPCDFAQGKGVLFVVGKYIEPFYVTYTGSGITTTQITLKIRDFEGVDDSLTIAERPTPTLSTEHKYNLLNQGWANPEVTTPGATNYDKYITDFNTSESKYPSNADYLGYGFERFVDSANNIVTKFAVKSVAQARVGNTPAPKGHYILDAFNKDRDAASGLTGIADETQSVRPVAVSFFAGRVWFTGIKGNLYFSQLLKEDLSNVGYCYQDADPTSTEVSDLVDTDGGVVKIPDAGSFVALTNVRTSIVILADNGVWEIRGVDGAFKATDYVLTKVGDFGCVGNNTVVNVGTTILWWGEEGIFTLSIDDVSGNFKQVNVTQDTIQTFYNDIPLTSKRFAKGMFNRISKRVQWVYKSGTAANTRYKYDSSLILDTDLGAFYTWSFATADATTPFVAGIVETLNTVSTVTEEVKYRYFIVVPGGTDGTTTFTYGYAKDRTFHDWATKGAGTGVNYSSYVRTGYMTFEDPSVEKQIDTLVIFFKRTEENFVGDDTVGYEFDYPSGCYFRARYEWSDNSNPNKWTTPEQVYRLKLDYRPENELNLEFDNGYPINTTKLRAIRGQGKAVQFEFYSEQGKDFNLLGWVVKFSRNEQA